ncbi:MAG: UDP-N-acetylglucosamine--N-acetylmuramyl-(pentapeptide) pyrophosphoryl-undecaprenol N-acetylglucosamine transferase [Candidatus Paceibacterota bacterium]|jgi:UDP-N-acetylglucosamine--N-acetylmuramyl-(pentapeptide) pyrophosphoryl-undecaprenol N-acetylglucosamine transferase
MRNIRIAFTGGGSGGHINPLLAVAGEARKIISYQKDNTFELFYFGDPGIFRADFVSLGIKIMPIIGFKIRRYFSLENIIDIIKFPFSVLQALWKIFRVMPDVIFSKGGTGALSVVIACYIFNVPIFVHESDSIPGATNSLSFKMARRIALSFSKSLDFISGPRVAVVGNPVRSLFLEEDKDLDPKKAKRMFGFESDLPLILILGGSQGAVRINDFLLDNIKELVSKYQVLHQVGMENFASFKAEIAVATKNLIPEEKARYKIVDFLKKDIKEAMIASDLIISRSGSSSIFEIAMVRKPSILIPLKESARNHQSYNAYEYAKTGAALVIEEDNLKPSLFFIQMDMILLNKQKSQKMSEASESFAKPQAALVIAQELVRLAVSK